MQKGETLYSLSRRYDIPVDELMSVNGIIKPESVREGTQLIIPSQKNLQNSGNESYTTLYNIREYEVVKGDTYYGIAKKQGMTVPELLALNGLTVSDVLLPGQVLRVSVINDADINVRETVQRRDQNDNNQIVDMDVSYSNGFYWPVEGTREPMSGKLEGIKIAADGFSYVFSVSNGTVVWIGPYRGFGNVILINSHGYIYMYGGNEDMFVNVGESVSSGTKIGRLGSSGNFGEKKEMYFSVCHLQI